MEGYREASSQRAGGSEEEVCMSGFFGVAGMDRCTGATGSAEEGEAVELVPEPWNEYDRNGVLVLDAE